MPAGFAEVNGAQLYYEMSGEGTPFVMIHAGIADSRMWNHEFDAFSKHYQVLRFDIRGYGKSEPVAGEWNIQDDFEVLLQALDINPPMILMGCSIGAGLALDFTLNYPDRVQALILVGGYPRGFETDATEPDHLFAEAEKAFQEGNLEHAAEIETQVWVDGIGRTKDDLDPAARQLAYEMNLLALQHASKKLDKHIRKDHNKPAIDEFHKLSIPTLVIVGENDLDTITAAAAYMSEHIPSAQSATLTNAAHLPNLEHPEQFQHIIDNFLQSR